jgi:3',5'-cyclic-AMP phosphodiesterase
MRLAWATDLHLNFARPPAQERFFESLLAQQADALVITGDIAEAPDFDLYLAKIARRFAQPVYYVLGNHDFYRSSVADVRQRARLTQAVWLNRAGVVELTPLVALVGHDGWADARLGHYDRSNVVLNDFFLISELKGLSRTERRTAMERLAEEAAAHFRQTLPLAWAKYDHVVVATHVPPFREATWHEGQISDDDWLPFFSSQVAGEAILTAALAHPEKRITVLCGHTHGAGVAHPAPNLTVYTGGAVYGQPAPQEPLELGPDPVESSG